MKALLPVYLMLIVGAHQVNAAFDDGVWSESSVSQTFSHVREVASDDLTLEEQVELLEELCNPPEKCGKTVKSVNCEKAKSTHGC